MEFLYFVRNFERMCDHCSGEGCSNCPLHEQTGNNDCAIWCMDRPVEAEKIVADWSKAHPIKTRLTEFKKLFPHCEIEINTGLPGICPAELGVSYECSEIDCDECRKQFWNQEIESCQAVKPQLCEDKSMPKFKAGDLVRVTKDTPSGTANVTVNRGFEARVIQPMATKAVIEYHDLTCIIPFDCLEVIHDEA